ncbi:MAG: isopentenyl-diphosphate delta-isomerase [Bacteroidetes bacterium 43-16]|nr:MAG: isopentenyl-diphosphate delta-isomerase [Bacteroidetes bacterium 43-16]
MQRDKVILVDQNDTVIGEMDKMEAHVKGALHRAFSIFLFNSQKEMLIHQRAAAKYHGGGLWTNACCSHPQPGEALKDSALQRLEFEMGLQCDIQKAFSFIYHTPVENGLIEHEYDHVYIGFTDALPCPHPDEVQDYRWISSEALAEEMELQPENFTFWFRKAVQMLPADIV